MLIKSEEGLMNYTNLRSKNNIINYFGSIRIKTGSCGPYIGHCTYWAPLECTLVVVYEDFDPFEDE